jgi:hypothetical protein
VIIKCVGIVTERGVLSVPVKMTPKRDVIIRCVGIVSECGVSSVPVKMPPTPPPPSMYTAMIGEHYLPNQEQFRLVVTDKKKKEEEDNNIGVEPKEEDSSSAKNKIPCPWWFNGNGDVVPNNGRKFSPEESYIIKVAIEEYCTRKNVDKKALGALGTWVEIAKKLPDWSKQVGIPTNNEECLQKFP